MSTIDNKDEVRMLALEDLLGSGCAEAFDLAAMVARGRHALAVNRGDDVGAIRAQRNLIKYALAEGDDEEAIAIGFLCFKDCQEKLGLRHSEGARVQAEVARVLDRVGRRDEALEFIREAHEVLEALEGPNSPDTLDAAVALALTLVEFELAKEAEPILARVYGAQARDYGEMHSYTLSTLSHLVPLRIFRGCVDEAMPSIEQAVRGWTRLHGPRDRRVLTSQTWQALVLGLEEKLVEACDLARNAFDVFVETFLAGTPDALLPAAMKGVLLQATGASDKDVHAHLAVAVAHCGYAPFLAQLSDLKAKLVPITGEFHAFAKALKAQVEYVENAEDLRPPQETAPAPESPAPE